MTEKEFFDYFIEEYVNKTGGDLPAGDLGYYLEYFLDNYPPEKLGLKLTKKIAARIIHEFMVNVFKIEDSEWKESAKLKDIYDCRVCSNAIAQVYDRGIIEASSDMVFGLNDHLTKDQAQEITARALALLR